MKKKREVFLNKIFNFFLACAYCCIKFIGLIIIFIGEMLNDRNGLLLLYFVFFIHEFIFSIYLYNSNKKETIHGRMKWQSSINQKVLVLANILMSLYCIYALISLIYENGISSCIIWGIISLYEIVSTIIALVLSFRHRTTTNKALFHSKK